MTDEDNIIYRVLFQQNGDICEVYSRYISEENLVGFLEVDELVLTESRSTVLVDPKEEKLRHEFKDVQRSYIPIHLVLRIDEVLKSDASGAKDASSTGTNVSPFPGKKFRQTTPVEDNSE